MPGTEITMVKPWPPFAIQTGDGPPPIFKQVYIFAGTTDPDMDGEGRIKIVGWRRTKFLVSWWRPVEYETDEEFLRACAPDNFSTYTDKIVRERIRAR